MLLFGKVCKFDHLLDIDNSVYFGASQSVSVSVEF